MKTIIALLIGILLIACEPINQPCIDNIAGTWFRWESDSSELETFYFDTNGIMQYRAQSNPYSNVVDTWGGRFVNFTYELYPHKLKLTSHPRKNVEVFKYQTRYEIFENRLTIWHFSYNGKEFEKVILLKK